MKKFVVFPVLLALLLAPVFAQEEEREPGWTFSGEAAVVADLVYYTKASGKTGGDNSENWGKNLDGSLNFMNTKGGGTSLGVGSSFFIKGYDKGDNYGYDMQLQLNFGIFGRGSELHKGEEVTFMDLLEAGFGDWFITGHAGMFEGYIGNTGYAGAVSPYGNFTDWSNFKLEGFYVKYYDMDEGEFAKQDTNKMNLWSGGSSFALAMNFLDDSLRFALGTDFGYGGSGVSFNDYDVLDSPYASANSINMAAIFSGKKLFDLLSFDVFYGIWGQDLNTNNPNGAAAYRNTFGLYAGLEFEKGFGLSVGYSGGIVVNEKDYGDPTASSTAVTIVNPFWSAVHLHANFSGLDKWDFTLNNNFSFAGATNKEADDKRFSGIYNSLSPFDEYGDKQGFFGWDLGLAVKFNVTDDLLLCFQLTNQLDTLSYTPKSGDKRSSSQNTLFAGFNAEYTIKMVSFGAGLTFTMTSYGSKEGSTKGPSANEIALGIPLFFKVVF